MRAGVLSSSLLPLNLNMSQFLCAMSKVSKIDIISFNCNNTMEGPRTHIR